MKDKRSHNERPSYVISNSLNAFLIALKKIDKSEFEIDVLHEYINFPSQFIQNDELKSDGQKELLEELGAMYKGAAEWILSHTYPSLIPRLIDHLPQCKPLADLSMHRLEFCYQIWLSVPFAQKIARNYKILWLYCEMSDCFFRLRGSGFWGNPVLDDEGKTFGKRKLVSLKQKILNSGIGSILDFGDLSQVETTPVTSQDQFAENFTNILLNFAMETAIESNDNNLKRICKTWLSHQADYERILKDSEDRQLPYIRGENLEWTAKGKKVWKPELDIKRGKGRPPKSNKGFAK